MNADALGHANSLIGRGYVKLNITSVMESRAL
jgi:hypothetical protein